MLSVCRRTVRGRSESGHPADGETDTRRQVIIGTRRQVSISTRRQVIIGIDYDYIFTITSSQSFTNRIC
jgi:hypothetical protein